jgi:hypothetical protein
VHDDFISKLSRITPLTGAFFFRRNMPLLMALQVSLILFTPKRM